MLIRRLSQGQRLTLFKDCEQTHINGREIYLKALLRFFMSFWQIRKKLRACSRVYYQMYCAVAFFLFKVPSVYIMATVLTSHSEQDFESRTRHMLPFLSFSLFSDTLKLTECMLIFLGKKVYSLLLTFGVRRG